MKHLTSEQRYVIKLMLREGKSQKEIAQSIDVHKSIISRDLKRKWDPRNGMYDCKLAQRIANRLKKDKPRKEVSTQTMKEEALKLLERKSSTEQIKGRMRLEAKEMVSHEMLYKWI